LQADLHTVRSAPLLASEARAAMVAQISALAQIGRPHVSPAIEHGEPVEFATHEMEALARGETVAHVGWTAFNSLATFAWLHEAALIKKLSAEIDGESSDDAALSAADRKAREADLLGDIEATQKQIAALIRAAEADNIAVEFEADTPPEVILGIIVVVLLPPSPEPAGVELTDEVVRHREAVIGANGDPQAITKAIAASMPS
jgi:hypothetical protein